MLLRLVVVASRGAHELEMVRLFVVCCVCVATMTNRPPRMHQHPTTNSRPTRRRRRKKQTCNLRWNEERKQKMVFLEDSRNVIREPKQKHKQIIYIFCVDAKCEYSRQEEMRIHWSERAALTHALTHSLTGALYGHRPKNRQAHGMRRPLNGKKRYEIELSREMAEAEDADEIDACTLYNCVVCVGPYVWNSGTEKLKPA